MLKKLEDDIVEADSSKCAVEKIDKQIAEMVAWTFGCSSITFMEFEQQLISKIFILGKLFVLLFLTMREEHYRDTHQNTNAYYKNQGTKPHIFACFFGKLRYWRSYLFNVAGNGGHYPLDIELGLTQDSFSMLVQNYAVRLATKVSYSQTVALLTLFLNWSPAQRTIEETVLGFGKHTADWFASQPAPENDGDVLIIQIDSKAVPTATAGELEKRRGKREVNCQHGSKRHRNKHRGRNKRRKKGDKSKNGKMATIVVMYTLKRAPDGTLAGPINKKVYASYAPKRHAVAIARREADKRGFVKGDGKQVQIITDGDNDLACYIKEFFPTDIHTIDVFHVMEYLWEAGGCIFREGSEELIAWVEEQKEALYEGRISEIIERIDNILLLLPKTGPGMKSRRERLEKVRNYLNNRITKMDYKSLLEQDLEISSGMVEGAVKYVIAKRFDDGGMRWIKEKAEALLQLRCIEINGDWDTFISFVHDRMNAQAQQSLKIPILRSREPAPLPTYGLC